MEIVKAFTSNKLHTNIVIKGTHNDPLFRASDIGEILELTNIRVTIKDFDETEKISVSNPYAGNSTITFLTEKGLYNVLFISRKPIAKTFKNWVFTIIKEIRLNGEYKLNKENEELKQQIEQKEEETIKNQSTITDLHYKNIELEKFKTHEFLIKYNRKKNLVYFCILQSFLDGSFIMKVGWTKDIETRIPALNAAFGTKCIVLNVFVCEDSYNLEQFLHNSPELVKYKYTELINNKVPSTESYHIPNQKEYEKLVKFTNSDMNKYNSIEIIKLRVEEKRLNIEEKKVDLVSLLIPICKNYDEVMNILNKITSQFTQIYDKPEKEENMILQIENIEQENIKLQVISHDNIKEPVDKEQILQTNANSTGPIVQVYHKDDLNTVVYVFDSITEATRDFKYNDNTSSFTSIKKAYQHKTLYLDHRWHFISNRKEINLNNPRDIGETIITRERNQGQVVMLNINKTKILKVFKLSKDAAEEILQHPSAMSSAIKFSTPLNNYYWMRWENVDKSIQDDYLLLNQLPEKQKNIRGCKINQIDPITNLLIKTFASYTDIQKELKISPKKIKEIIETKENYQGKYVFTLA